MTGNGSAGLNHRIEAIYVAAGSRKPAGTPKTAERDQDNVRPHDLRRTFTTTAAELGYSDATIDKMTAHACRGVTASSAQVPRLSAGWFAIALSPPDGLPGLARTLNSH